MFSLGLTDKQRGATRIEAPTACDRHRRTLAAAGGLQRDANRGGQAGMAKGPAAPLQRIRRPERGTAPTSARKRFKVSSRATSVTAIGFRKRNDLQSRGSLEGSRCVAGISLHHRDVVVVLQEALPGRRQRLQLRYVA